MCVQGSGLSGLSSSCWAAAVHTDTGVLRCACSRNRGRERSASWLIREPPAPSSLHHPSTCVSVTLWSDSRILFFVFCFLWGEASAGRKSDCLRHLIITFNSAASARKWLSNPVCAVYVCNTRITRSCWLGCKFVSTAFGTLSSSFLTYQLGLDMLYLFIYFFKLPT